MVVIKQQNHAIKYTKFKPAKFKGESVKSQLKISVEFKSYNN